MKINGIDQQRDTVTTHFEFDNGNTTDDTKPMVHVCCPVCYEWILFWPHVLKARQADGMAFYCPNGHKCNYPGNTDAQMKEFHEWHFRLAESHQELRDEAEQMRRTIAGLRGTITRLKKASKGKD